MCQNKRQECSDKGNDRNDSDETKKSALDFLFDGIGPKPYVRRAYLSFQYGDTGFIDGFVSQ